MSGRGKDQAVSAVDVPGSKAHGRLSQVERAATREAMLNSFATSRDLQAALHAAGIHGTMRDMHAPISPAAAAAAPRVIVPARDPPTTLGRVSGISDGRSPPSAGLAPMTSLHEAVDEDRWTREDASGRASSGHAEATSEAAAAEEEEAKAKKGRVRIRKVHGQHHHKSRGEARQVPVKDEWV